MKILLIIFIYLLTAFQSANAGGIPYTFNQKILQGKVFRVLDGDTIEIKTLPAKIVVYEVPIRVRLINIDAPEKKQPFGRWSTSQLKTLVAGKQVTVSYSHKDRYGRIIGHVFTTNGTDASRFMVQSGAAWVYERYNGSATGSAGTKTWFVGRCKSGSTVGMAYQKLRGQENAFFFWFAMILSFYLCAILKASF